MHFNTGIEAGEGLALQPTGEAAGGHLAQHALAASQHDEHDGIDEGEAWRAGLRAARQGMPSPGHENAALTLHHRLVHPALGALPVADAPPGVELVDDLHRHAATLVNPVDRIRTEEHTSELQSIMRISYAVF